ncbi:hypothetical protein CVT25_013161, partial [Psilocybe cyanescens]
ARASENALNPFLVILNAEIAFRRFKRRPHPLCAEYTELIDLTIDLVHKLYFKPLVDQIEWKRAQARLAYSTDPEGNANMAGTVDEFGTGKAEDKNTTITPRVIDKKSRTGTVVTRPGPIASHDEVIEYNQYLMSGCGRHFLFSSYVYHYDVDDEDEEDDEDSNGQLPELGLPTRSGEHDIRAEYTSPIGVFDKVQQWQVEVQ